MFMRVYVLRMTTYALKQRSINAHTVPMTNIEVVRNSIVSLTGYRGCPERDSENKGLAVLSKVAFQATSAGLRKWSRGG